MDMLPNVVWINLEMLGCGVVVQDLNDKSKVDHVDESEEFPPFYQSLEIDTRQLIVV